jgi:hypothetical protein
MQVPNALNGETIINNGEKFKNYYINSIKKYFTHFSYLPGTFMKKMSRGRKACSMAN